MAKETPTKTISVEEFLRKQAELDQEKQAVIAQLEAEIKERQDLLAKLRGEAQPVKKRIRRTQAEIEAARAAEGTSTHGKQKTAKAGVDVGSG